MISFENTFRFTIHINNNFLKNIIFNISQNDINFFLKSLQKKKILSTTKTNKQTVPKLYWLSMLVNKFWLQLKEIQREILAP
jgi:hypothetical protein